MKMMLRVLFLGILALLAAACATQASVTPTTVPADSVPAVEPTAVPVVDSAPAAEAVPVAAKPRFIDSFADW